MQVTQLAVYPIKSTGQVPLESAVVTPRGFKHDRRWLLVDENDRFITQRQYPLLALVRTEFVESGLLISRPDAEGIYVPTPAENGVLKTVTVWKDCCNARDAGDEAAEWFSRVLGMMCRLVYQPDHSIRPTDARYSGTGDHTSFADGFPFLLTNEASLLDLNDRLTDAVAMSRFRPNIVFSGQQPFQEDGWSRIQVGDIAFRVVKPCSRCVMTTVNPDNGQKEGREPLMTLSRYRRTDMGVIFGQNLIPDQEGIIRVGDRVRILDSRV
ncbi:MOSC domain-containing protein [Endozoicomonas sp.]|uniref:MOSC domain-containing protein n=1 Tax=Endozoicomonas sp. TaxID=1892382 RepID=UPI00288790FA|nr:MOSC domain-containing protein [Endozoicomonas sp.]